jgi:micrococcal nuclease
MVRRLAVIGIIAFLLLGWLNLYVWQADPSSYSEVPTTSVESVPVLEPLVTPASSEFLWLVTRVVDGDTIWVEGEGKRLKVRLIGVDTPETVHPTKEVECYGPESSDFAKDTLAGTQVAIVTDASQGEVDKYGRTLAYVFLPDGQLFQELLVSGGYAYEYTFDQPYEYRDLLIEAEEQARLNGAGLWTKCSNE